MGKRYPVPEEYLLEFKDEAIEILKDIKHQFKDDA